METLRYAVVWFIKIGKVAVEEINEHVACAYNPNLWDHLKH